MAEASRSHTIMQGVALVLLFIAACQSYWVSAKQQQRLEVGDDFMEWAIELHLSGDRFTWQDGQQMITKNGLKQIEKPERKERPPESVLRYYREKNGQNVDPPGISTEVAK